MSVSLLFWQRVSAGHHCASVFTARRSRATGMWSLYATGGRYLGFRPTLCEVKALAELEHAKTSETAPAVSAAPTADGASPAGSPKSRRSLTERKTEAA